MLGLRTCRAYVERSSNTVALELSAACLSILQ